MGTVENSAARSEPGSLPESLIAAARAWLAGDPDPADRAEIEALLWAAAADTHADAAAGADEAGRNGASATVRAELADRFAGPLRFGTAGLRGPLRAGPNGMNTAVVRRAAAGLAAWLAGSAGRADEPALSRGGTREGADGSAAGPRTVVIGFDARHRSDAFAVDSARVFAGAGLRALLLPGPLPTPVLAFAVRHLDADAGVMVTASHNPATDNGYKVYLGAPPGDPGRGAQLVSPADGQIEAAIAAAPPAAAVPLADTWTRLDDGIVAAYVTAAAATLAEVTPTLPPSRAGAAAAGLRIAYTPLHGVGHDVLRRVFAAAGLPEPAAVAEQAEPDPDFPTARFPNPEEPGAMDHVLALGRRIGADVVLAHDPDADRLAVAVGRDPRVLTGDELGLLLADEMLRHSPGPLAATVVSSTAPRMLAARRGVPYTETLTGFKWIMRADPGLVFGYEEALGYAVRPDLVRDKDGITAAVAVARMAAAERARGRTLLDRLDDLAHELGVVATTQVSIPMPGLAASTALLRRFRESPPSQVAGLPVLAVRDLLAPVRDGLPTSDVLVLSLADGARAVLRPSGTEPKIKIYLETTERVGSEPGSLADARTAAAAHLARLTAWARTLLDTTVKSPRSGEAPTQPSHH
ncbi:MULTISPECIES: phospho-sugar mutase [unclassified Pseudofrankia]|uniref:phospho-sugar mutase n=1 Tax=unclassified Pseudofrankia TaxID=2994372 RepID=UPI0008D9759D|nr:MULTISPECIES: phospho-sugar mutase [unclassified Pseudofrankia]MDT3438449.1 phospho-sugar mutase [Pseudofrankia sp. BMG5.37]OHV45421.1 phosphoglucomutase [Pseudofrankia sp. BMG5.36]